MRGPVRLLVSAAITLVAFGGVAPAAVAAAPPATHAESAAVTHTTAYETSAARDCIAGHNMDEVVAKFISRCKQGKIRQKITSDRLSRTLGEIYAGKQRGDRDDVTAWKVLNDHRFDK